MAGNIATKIWQSGEYSDMTIVCQDRRFKVHKAILCTQSKVLKTAMDGPFQEGTTGVIELQEEDPDIVALMIEYLYSQTYDRLSPAAGECKTEAASSSAVPNIDGTSKAHTILIDISDGQSESVHVPDGWIANPCFARLGEPLVHTMVYILAEKYDLQGLKAFSANKYHEMALMGSRLNQQSFMLAVSLLYQNTLDTDSAMRPHVVELGKRHAAMLANHPGFREMAQNSGDFVTDVFIAQYARKSTLVTAPLAPRMPGKVAKSVRSSQLAADESATTPRKAFKRSAEVTPAAPRKRSKIASTSTSRSR